MHVDPPLSDPENSEEQDSSGVSPAVASSRPLPGAGLAVAALVVPVITGMMQFFVTSLLLSFVISAVTILATATLLSIDAHRLASSDPARRQPESLGTFVLGMLLLWIVVYPLAFFRRSRFGGPRLGIPAVGVALFAGLGPMIASIIQPLELPSCTSQPVVALVEQTLQGTPFGGQIESIDEHKEVSYDRDAEIRHGTCVVHTNDSDFEVSYRVEWQNRNEGRFTVTCAPLPMILPRGDSREVVETLRQVLANTDAGVSVQSIEDHQELRYDEREEVRYCKCTVQTVEGPKEVRYVVEWLDRDSGYFGVRVPPADLPDCTNDEVVKLLEKVIRRAPLGPFVKSIDGHQEVSYDPQTNVRRGQCIVHLTGEDISVSYTVEWRDRERGLFQVRTLE